MFPLKDDLPTSRFPAITVALIAINVLAYFIWQRGGITSGPDEAQMLTWGWIPWEIQHAGEQCSAAGDQIMCGSEIAGQPVAVTALTSMFMHGSVFHLGGNMLFLWIFGNNIEDGLGRVKFIGFYLAAGVAAIALQTLLSSGDDAAIPMIGASGAIAGVLGGYVLLYPRARVLTVVLIILFFTILRIPALVMLGVWFAQQAILGALGLTETVGDGDGVAYFAHIGGFAFGLLAIKLLRPERNPIYDQLVAARRNPQSRALTSPEAPARRGRRSRW